MDSDENGSIDPMEIIDAIESLGLDIKSDETKEKTTGFPSPLQQFLMGKKAADIYYPIIHFLAFTFISPLDGQRTWINCRWNRRYDCV